MFNLQVTKVVSRADKIGPPIILDDDDDKKEIFRDDHVKKGKVLANFIIKM